jgi:hypothetical protein
MKPLTEQQPGQATPTNQHAGPRREQQITIEERTGQGFADPAEKQHRHSGPAASDPDHTIGYDDGMDVGM